MPGGVVSAIALQEFLETLDWLEPLFADLPNSSLYLDVDNSRQLQAIAQQIRQTIQTSALPAAWSNQLEQVLHRFPASALILRPSLGVAPEITDPTLGLKTGGLLDSQVCQPDIEALGQALKRVWAELFRARSLVYWQRAGIQLQHMRLGVLIQPVWPAIAAGDLIVEEGQIEIRSIWGLGHGLARGEVPPDHYEAGLETNQIQTRQLARKAYAYRVARSGQEGLDCSAEATLLASAATCLQIYPVDRSQQTQPALSTEQLQTLVELARQITQGLGRTVKLEWTLCEAAIDPSDLTQNEARSGPTLYVTQINPHSNAAVMPNINNLENNLENFEEEPSEPKISSEPKTSEPKTSEPKTSEPKTSNNLTQHPSARGPRSLETQSSLVLRGISAAGGQAVASIWVATQPVESFPDLPPGLILVAPSITPDWLPWLKQSVGLITEEGGTTCHAAILARDLGIPALVGIPNVTRLLHTDDAVFLDGDRGEVYRLQTAAKDTHFEPDYRGAIAVKPPAAKASGSEGWGGSRPTCSRAIDYPLTATQLWVNLSQLHQVEEVAAGPVDGVGLLRSELMLQDVLDQQHPQHWIAEGKRTELIDRLADCIRQVAAAFAPRPIWYRSLDLRSHEIQLWTGSPDITERNPLLGLHGTLSYQTSPACFEAELAALRQVQQSGYENVHLLLPFVRTVEEFRFCSQAVEQAGLRALSSFQLWIMAEVPSVVFLLEDFIQAGVQGISIGSNDLTQLILGIDRDHPSLAAFGHDHPAVLQAIQQLIQTACRAGIPCSICGEAPSQAPHLIELLVQWGITSISVSPTAVEPTGQAIARAERKLLLQAARQTLAN